MIMARNRCYVPETGHDHESALGESNGWPWALVLLRSWQAAVTSEMDRLLAHANCPLAHAN
jgi:hypothetical protein